MEKLKYERPIFKKLNTGFTNKFGSQLKNEVVTHLEGVGVKELIRQYGSPLFVISEKQIRRNYQLAVRVFKTRYPKVQFAWSYKTNYLNAVCQIFHQEGSWAEVVSGFEYEKAIRNGVPGNKIIFNGPDKTDEQLIQAAQNNSLIHIDHFDELYSLIKLSEEMQLKPRVAIRVNMDTGIYPKWDRFGFNFENGQAWNAITRIINCENLNLVGLHCHIGTFMLDTDAYAIATSKLCELVKSIREKYNKTIQYLDLGGGFPSSNTLKGSYLPGVDTVPTIDQFADAITGAILAFGFKQEELPLLILETGRAMIDDAGYLLGTVLANKRLSDGRRSTILDFGVNSLFTSFWYDHKITPAQDGGQYTEETILYGPLCMNIDVVRENIILPLLQKGDHLVVHRVGAYNMTQWMQFITLRPNVVLLDQESHPHLIRKAETLEYIESVEQIPDHLSKNIPE
ncbi:MAG: alanine racemase [Prolixibacteraceae bacterium]